MSSAAEDSYHLSNEQRSVIKFMLFQGNTPEQIIQEWNVDYHKRVAPSIQTVYAISRQMNDCDNVDRKKPGPKKRSILTQEKLDEIEMLVESDPFITNDSLGLQVDLPTSTARDGVKILKLKTFHAMKSTELTEAQKEMRLSFCNSYLKWNQQFQMRIWWSDESTFKVEELIRYQPTRYRAKENQHMKKKKIQKQKSINVWAAIRGEGKLLFEVIDGKQNSENYIQLLFNKFPEMEYKTSFLMQDGAGIHTSDDALDWISFLWKDRWIGLKSPRLSFPPYSMDLTPMDFAFWAHVKYQVALRNPETTEELRNSIIEVLNTIEEDTIIRMCLGVEERCLKCLRYEGKRFERKP